MRHVQLVTARRSRTTSKSQHRRTASRVCCDAEEEVDAAVGGNQGHKDSLKEAVVSMTNSAIKFDENPYLAVRISTKSKLKRNPASSTELFRLMLEQFKKGNSPSIPSGKGTYPCASYVKAVGPVVRRRFGGVRASAKI